jgi:peptide deformylase
MEKIGLKIRLFGDPVLRKKAKPVRKVAQAHRDILSEMARLMHTCGGIGLAAPQVGVAESMIVVDVGKGLYKLINPKILKKEGRQILEEGCLSIPGVCIKVKRARKVVVAAQDEFAKPLTIEAQDLLACVLQHEIDHLKGKVIVDYASLFEKLKIKRKLVELKKRLKDEGMPESKTKSCQLQL